MIDLHNHLLPCVDDGSSSLDETMAMAAIYCDLGFTTVVATPHLPGFDLEPLTRQKIEEVLAITRQALQCAGLALDVLAGAEHYLDPTLLELGPAGLVPLGGEQGGALLVEYPWQQVGYTREVISRLLAQGHTLLLAHPERSLGVDLEEVAGWVQAGGVFIQCELHSFAGHFGPEAGQRAAWLVGQGLVHVVATDLHRVSGAAHALRQSLAVIEEMFGPQARDLWLFRNPRALLEQRFNELRGNGVP